MNISVCRVFWKDVEGNCTANDLRICCRILLKRNKRIVSECVLLECNCISRLSCPFCLYSLLCGHQIFLGGQVLNIPTWKKCWIIIMRSTIVYPAATSTTIVATVSKPIIIEYSCGPICVQVENCWRVLNWTPLSG